MIEEAAFQSALEALRSLRIEDLFPQKRLADPEIDRRGFEGVAIVSVQTERVLLLLPNREHGSEIRADVSIGAVASSFSSRAFIGIERRLVGNVRAQAGVDAQPLPWFPLHQRVRAKEITVVVNADVQIVWLWDIYRERTIHRHAVVEIGPVGACAAVQVVAADHERDRVLHLPSEVSVNVNVGQMDLF